MSILIRGMEMPHDGEFKRIRIYDNGDITVEFRDGEAIIAHAYPAPPHGDLIDRGKLLKGKQHYEYMSDEYYITVRDIEEAPTIIPAEPPKEET